jgi:hypothetical protein
MEKSGRSRIGRTLSWGQVGEQLWRAKRRHPGDFGSPRRWPTRGGAGRSSKQQLISRAAHPAERRHHRPRMTGSWAGAMGHTQFIPTSFEAVRGRLHRRRTARYLVGRSHRRAGLGRGLPVAQRLAARPALGLRGRLAASRRARVIQPQRAARALPPPAISASSSATTTSDAYAIGVGHLADRIAGARPVARQLPARLPTA